MLLIDSLFNYLQNKVNIEIAVKFYGTIIYCLFFLQLLIPHLWVGAINYSIISLYMNI